MIATKKKARSVEDNSPPPISTISPDTVLNGVLHILGKPSDMCSICSSFTRATAITQNNFRVNIYTESHLPGIAHTFFVNVDQHGNIVTSNPEISKHYE
jgi:hypothetical protein